MKLQELYYKTEYDLKEMEIILPGLINCTNITQHAGTNTLVTAKVAQSL